MEVGKTEMTCEQWSDQFRRWLEQEWTGRGAPECSAALKRHAESCPRCGARLQAAMLLAAGAPLERRPPPGLAERIGAGLSGATVGRPRGWQLRVGVAAAALLVVAAVFAVLLRIPGRAGTETVVVRFELKAPGATEVSVVGSWNRWDPDAQKLGDPDGDGVWEIEIPLKRGQEHEYQFLIDGQTWVPDPEAPLQVEDGFGGVNSVLQI